LIPHALRPVIAFQKHEDDAAAKMRSTRIVGQIDSPATIAICYQRDVAQRLQDKQAVVSKS